MTIENLSRLNDIELREQAEKKLFQQFKIRLTTKKDPEGNIKHSIVGKTMETIPERTAFNNI